MSSPFSSVYTLCFVAFGLISLALPQQSAFAGDSTHINAVLKEAMNMGGFAEQDLAMPYDYYGHDPQRKPIVEHLFEHPLDIHSVASTVKDSAMAGVNATFLKSCNLLNRSSAVPTFGKVVMAASDLDSLLGVRLDTICNNAESALLRRSLSRLVRLAQKTTTARNQLDSVQLHTVLSKADSLLLNSEDGPADIYTSREAQRRSLTTMRTYFRSADTAMQSIDDMYGIGQAAYDYSFTLVQELGKLDSADLRLIGSHEFETPYGRVAIGGLESNVYWGDYFLIVDVGGDDVYMHGDHDKYEAARHPLRVIIDLSGNDKYAGGDFSIASSVVGVSLLIDRAGNDTYDGRDFSVASALFGYAVLHDLAGNDNYTGRTCTQGSAAFGIAILQDDDGNDVYRCASQAQAFGFSEGAGWLIDKQGSDVYVTTSPFVDYLRYSDHFVAFTQGASLGFRPIASGGFGLLVDGQGSDTYITDIFGQATSYWYGLSVLYDCSGKDKYQAYQYAQGSGVHLAHAILIDSAGNDHYFSHGVSQGCGHDVATGVLYDYSGDDEYIAESLSQGAGNADAVSILADGGGNDVYVARNQNNTQGFSDFRRDFGMFGILADGDGTNIIGTRGELKTLKSTWGVALVHDGVEEAKKNTKTTAQPPKSPELTSTLDSLFVQASAAPFSVQHNVEPARDSIVGFGAEGLVYTAQFMDTELARERHAVEALLRKFFAKDTVAVTQLLRDSIHSKQSRTASMSRRVVGRLKVQDALPDLVQHLNDSSWHVRSSVVLTIGKIQPEVSDKKLVNSLVASTKDEQYMVQKRAAFTCGMMWRKLSKQQLNTIINNNSFSVRAHFAEGIVRSGDTLTVADAKMLLHIPTSKDARRNIAQALVRLEETESMREFLVSAVTRYGESVQQSFGVAMKRATARSDFFKDVAAQLNL